MIFFRKKTLCVPIYRQPHEVKEAAKKKLESLTNLSSVPWINPSTIFFNNEGLFSLKATNNSFLKVHVQQKLLSVVNLFHSPECTTSEREQRLHYARRRLLISIMAHAWLWGRPKVLDSQGNPVALQDIKVLAPERILAFLRDTRIHREGCPCEDIQGFLETVQEVPLPKDKSRWNMMAFTACLWWDNLHDLEDGMWCSCRIGPGRQSMTNAIDLARESLPPYHEAYLPPYYQVCPVERQDKEDSKS
ncbi:uncharacterized protein FOBCDRAFT_125967 [Fusarium oxysporum Fo47]|uniref:uncharacterized protein n=1 Tax=Fusarium oxysporum Fo47 TaxID=660027 RepID=UPI00159A16CD|nr:uncharacterized protein FOBCDRAFT_125967 [Fusarium oxysporum Fo47]QKD50463.1 hypothetical protein FOBCDRAFT_125967 [Fusarium oxysporum Fo47]